MNAQHTPGPWSAVDGRYAAMRASDAAYVSAYHNVRAALEQVKP